MENRIRLNFTWKEAALAIMWATFFLPPVIARISTVLSYGVMLIGYGVFLVMYIRWEKVMPISEDVMLFLVFVAYCVFTLLFRTPDKIPQFVRRAILPLIEGFFLIQWTFRERDQKNGFGVLYYVTAFYIVANFISLVLFPGGIIRSSAGSAIERAQWLFGSKNNIPLYMIVFITIAAYYHYTVRRRHLFYCLAALGAFSIMMSGEEGLEFLGGSSTGFVAYAASLALIVVCVHMEKVGKPALGVKAAFVFTIFMNVIILGGMSLPGMNDIIVNVFHKTTTFTGRSLIWSANLKEAFRHVILGQGEVSVMAHVRIQKEWVTTDYTYNCLLKLLLNYGLVGIGLFIAMVLMAARKLDLRGSILFSGFTGLLLIGLMNEVDMNWLLLFPSLMILA
ncbi:MAG: hypothetical protein Q4A32_02895 [Lachnospiraceae bacterium]|nr:hypothetical protein [Lachnospiraceae bacterium]